MTAIHIVQAANESLSQISRAYGVPLSVLLNINEIANSSRLCIGKKIYLRELDVLGVQFLLLDTDRNPIKNLRYVLEFSGRVIEGVTDVGGQTQQIFTKHATDMVRVLVARLDGGLKEVATVDSGYRNKLVKVISSRYRADSETVLDSAGTQEYEDAVKRKPLHAPRQRAVPTIGKRELGPVAAPRTNCEQRPVTEVKGDVPELDLFLDKYDGLKLSDVEISKAAAELKCEPGLIHAISKQESATSSFFQIGNRTVPKILFERHAFRDAAKKAGDDVAEYDKRYPDICGRPYRRATRDKKNRPIDEKTGLLLSSDDVYGAGGWAQYKRLLKAYQINPDAALRACSWGKFQIMGYNYDIAGFDDVKSFVRAISRNDAEHLKAFLQFAKKKAVLLSGLQQKDFEMIAAGHNGSHWKSINPKYADNLKKFYEEYMHDHAKSS